MTKYNAIKKHVFRIVNKAESGDRASEMFDWFIMSLIALSILSIVLESFSGISEKWGSVFDVFEVFTVIVFTIEYILRLWTADLLYPDAKHPRLKFFFSLIALIDLLAICPFYLPFISADLRFLRMMRLFHLFRLLRILKLGRYFDALQIIMKVIRASGPQLVMSVALCSFVMLYSAIIMYTVENPVQPEQFPNVIASLWWAICTLTTVGYGDVYPITDVGRFFASVISLVGVGIIAIPTGIIAAGFNQMIRKEKEEEQEPSVPALDKLNEKELLILHADLTVHLKQYGYSSTLTNAEKEEEKQPVNNG